MGWADVLYLLGYTAVLSYCRHRLRVSAETLCRTQAELGSMTSELEAERRGRDTAESQLSDLKEQVILVGI